MRVLTLGTFDLFHAGHVDLFRECADLGPVIVALNTDAFVAAFKGKPPVIPYEGRRRVLEACRYVQAVIPNCQTTRGSTAAPTIARAAPDVIVVGSDWRERDYLGQLGVTDEFLGTQGIAVRYHEYGDGAGSTGIKARVVELAR